jgi:hypothetical protein
LGKVVTDRESGKQTIDVVTTPVTVLQLPGTILGPPAVNSGRAESSPQLPFSSSGGSKAVEKSPPAPKEKMGLASSMGAGSDKGVKKARSLSTSQLKQQTPAKEVPRGLRANGPKNTARKKKKTCWGPGAIAKASRKFKIPLVVLIVTAIVAVSLLPALIASGDISTSLFQSETDCRHRREGLDVDMTAASHVFPAHGVGVMSTSFSFLIFVVWLFHSPHISCTTVKGRDLDLQLGTFLVVQLFLNVCHVALAFHNCVSGPTNHRISIGLANLVMYGSLLVPNFLMHRYCTSKAEVMSSDVLLCFMSRKWMKHKGKGWLSKITIEHVIKGLLWEARLLPLCLLMPMIFDVAAIPVARSVVFLVCTFFFLGYHMIFSHAVTMIYLRPLDRVIQSYRPPRRAAFNSDEDFDRALQNASSPATKTAKQRLLNTKFYTKIGMIICVIASACYWLDIALYVLSESVFAASTFDNMWLNPFIMGFTAHSVALQLGMLMISGTLVHVLRMVQGGLRKIVKMSSTSNRSNNKMKDRFRSTAAIGKRFSSLRTASRGALNRTKSKVVPWLGQGIVESPEGDYVRNIESLGSYDAHKIHAVRD